MEVNRLNTDINFKLIYRAVCLPCNNTNDGYRNCTVATPVSYLWSVEVMDGDPHLDLMLTKEYDVDSMISSPKKSLLNADAPVFVVQQSNTPKQIMLEKEIPATSSSLNPNVPTFVSQKLNNVSQMYTIMSDKDQQIKFLEEKLQQQNSKIILLYDKLKGKDFLINHIISEIHVLKERLEEYKRSWVNGDRLYSEVSTQTKKLCLVSKNSGEKEVSNVTDISTLISEPSANMATKKLKDQSKEIEKLQHLLDKSLRGGPVNISLQINIDSVGPINEKDYTFVVGFYLNTQWSDPRLADILSTTFFASQMDHLIWVPDITVSDYLDSRDYKSSVKTIIKRNGDIYLRKKYTITTKHDMNFCYYPFDTHIQRLSFENSLSSIKDINLYWQKVPVNQKDNLSMNAYHLMEITVTKSPNLYGLANDTVHSNMLNVYFKVRRSSIFHIYHVYIPSALSMLFAFLSFWISEKAECTRAGLISVSFLVNAIILNGQNDDVTKASCTTALEIFLDVNLALVSIILIEFLAVLKVKISENENIESIEKGNLILENHVVKRKKHDNAQTKDKVTEYTSPSVEVDGGPVLVQNKKFRLGVRVIDRTASIVFPTFYALFCVVYFTYYILHAQE